MSLGGRVEEVNAQGHGVTELSALGRHVHILDYLLQLCSTDPPSIWNRLAVLAGSDRADEAESTVQVM